ncbi:hypothetical protein ACFMKD_30425, partial [Acinetobacter baumannii]
MTQSTLYLVQASYHHTPRIIEELAKLFHKDDQIVFMGDSTAQLSVNICQQFGSVSCLSHEKDLIDAVLVACGVNGVWEKLPLHKVAFPRLVD